jgi:hypothetical protein
MAAQPLVRSSAARQLPSRFNLARQITGGAGFAASCALLAAIALSGCAADGDGEAALDLAVCAAPDIYRIDRVELPRDNDGARSLGLDLDGDGASDNVLGQVAGTLDDQLGPLDMAAVMSDRLAGEVEWKLAVRSCGDRVAVSLGRGDRLDEVQLVGPAAGTGPARGAGGELPLSLMFDPGAQVADPGWVAGATGAIELDRAADGARFSARLGLAFDGEAAFEAIVPPLARFLDAHLAGGSYLIAYLDRNGDGRITEQELRDSPGVRALFAPDLRVDGAPQISLGVGLSGVRAP